MKFFQQNLIFTKLLLHLNLKNFKAQSLCFKYFYIIIIVLSRQNVLFMKKTIILFISLLSFAVYSQQKDYSAYFKTATKLNADKLNQYVSEVYGTHAEAHKNTKHYQLMRELIEYRISVVTLPDADLSEVISTDQVALLNKHNDTLQHDTQFDANTFNPFKYNLEFFSKDFKTYRVGQSNTLLLIAPK